MDTAFRKGGKPLLGLRSTVTCKGSFPATESKHVTRQAKAPELGARVRPQREKRW